MTQAIVKSVYSQVGLNLQAADTVIMFDTDWNPSQDLQAQARVHRLGQAADVLVLRLFIPGTIEEHILKISGQKQGLAAAVLEGGAFDGKTDAKARHALLLDIIQRSSEHIGDGAAIPATAQEVCLSILSNLTTRKLCSSSRV